MFKCENIGETGSYIVSKMGVVSSKKNLDRIYYSDDCFSYLKK